MIGCNNNKNCFSDRVKIIDDSFEIPNIINGEKLPVNEIYRISSLICFDEYLLILTPRANNVFNVLTLNGKVVSQFGTIGKANDEIMNCQFNGQTEKIEGNNCVWINDVSKARLLLIDIDKSIEKNKITIMREAKTSPMSVYNFCVNDSIIITEELTGNNFEFIKHNVNLNTYYQETLYNDDSQNAFNLYKSIWRLNPHKNKIIGAMQSVNQINFYSMDNHERWSVVIGKQSVEKNKLIDVETGLAHTVTFCDLEVTDSYIYALYMNQNQNDAYEKTKSQELLVFDLNGNYIRTIILNEYIIDIAISRNEKFLYGRTPDDNIYRYKL